MDAKQRDFLRARLEQQASIQPDFFKLRKLLLQISGDELVAPEAADPDLDRLLSEGSLLPGAATLEELEENSCHVNSAALWIQKRTQAIGTGYALSPDGLWRQHSWGMRASEIVETTVIRTHYFGLLLQNQDASEVAALYFDS